MFTVLIGLSSALIYGAADFLGGLGARRISPVRVTAISGVSGLVVLLVALPLIPSVWSSEAVLLGALSGISGAAAVSLLYACLAIGPMSILSPLTAVVSAIVPLTVGLVRGERLGAIGYLAIGLALVAVVLVGFVKEKNAVRPSLRGVLMAIGSGAAIGLFLIIIDLTPENSGLVPLIMNRVVSAAIMFALVGALVVMARRRSSAGVADASGGTGALAVAGTPGVGLEARVQLWRPGVVFAIACGAVDAIANAGLLWGLRIGELSIISVLTALYPAGTIILAAIVLKERIAVVQYVGLALAITAAGMLALT